MIDYLDEARYVGVEVRAEALEEGLRELVADTHLEWKRPQLVQSDDLRGLSLELSCDYVWAFSVLIHMTDDVLDGCLAFVARHLAPDGVLLANVNVGVDGPTGRWREFPVMGHPWRFYEELASAHGPAVKDLGCIRDLGDAGMSRLDPHNRRMVGFQKPPAVWQADR